MALSALPEREEKRTSHVRRSARHCLGLNSSSEKIFLAFVSAACNWKPLRELSQSRSLSCRDANKDGGVRRTPAVVGAKKTPPPPPRQYQRFRRDECSGRKRRAKTNYRAEIKNSLPIALNKYSIAIFDCSISAAASVSLFSVMISHYASVGDAQKARNQSPLRRTTRLSVGGKVFASSLLLIHIVFAGTLALLFASNGHLF